MKCKLKALEEKQLEAELRSSKSLISVAEEDDRSRLGSESNDDEGDTCPGLDPSRGDSKTKQAAKSQIDGSRSHQKSQSLREDGQQAPRHGGKTAYFQDLPGVIDMNVLPIGTQEKDKAQLSLTACQVEPDRLPRAEPQSDGRIVLKGMQRFKASAGRDKHPKLESFDRKLGRQPNAIIEVRTSMTISSKFLARLLMQCNNP